MYASSNSSCFGTNLRVITLFSPSGPTLRTSSSMCMTIRVNLPVIRSAWNAGLKSMLDVGITVPLPVGLRSPPLPLLLLAPAPLAIQRSPLEHTLKRWDTDSANAHVQQYQQRLLPALASSLLCQRQLALVQPWD